MNTFLVHICPMQSATPIHTCVKAVPLRNHISEHSKVAFLIKIRSSINSSNRWWNLKRNPVIHSLSKVIYLPLSLSIVSLSDSLPFPLHSPILTKTVLLENLFRLLETIELYRLFRMHIWAFDLGGSLARNLFYHHLQCQLKKSL